MQSAAQVQFESRCSEATPVNDSFVPSVCESLNCRSCFEVFVNIKRVVQFKNEKVNLTFKTFLCI